ncbi:MULTISPECIES: HypC/HybG/HupF family hydrogenase formation chaperone [Clostridium]|uniref:HypC/HybG/HupF family hydrogenase formation chaperone n=2 Tax=Clostridium TaxID=1485 RepID=A0ABU1EJB4_9CLOT|nr:MULTISPECIES: HypC/HybG/HupF family hydrogenase formation chaperone [unclassified Clostridium]MDR5588490.1 HypC/HybG/HupF family hydrogenase formation chaperone [Clostridium sp. 5N-1]NFG61699.1 HypC/HybG/HupF family hydrogenase formation chaperone [Clostridium botulinum]NFQ08484.1 HypC/HybG/HupF family hydrogenase formation chaperone [Clostridium botulinum]
MCVAIPGKVLEIYNKDALIQFGKINKVINIELIEDLKKGEYVLVHAGCAIEKKNEEEALEILEIFKTLIM